MAPRFWSPLHLSGVTEVDALSSVGQTATIDPQRLLNPNRGPMLIDQIRFGFVTDDNSIIANPYLLLATMTAEIMVGPIPVMSKPVTMGAFVPLYVGSLLAPPAGPLWPKPGFDLTLVWHLDRPLFVPQNVQLTVRLGRQRIFETGYTFPTEPVIAMHTVRVSVVGRSLPEEEPTPERIWVPWVSETKTGSAASSYTSPDSDLINPHSEMLHVKAFCGVNVHQTETLLSPTQGDLRVQMTASNGLAFIRDLTPFFALFPQDRQRLAVDAMLQPGQFFRCRLENGIENEVPPGDWPVGFTSVGMTGYRLMPAPKANR